MVYPGAGLIEKAEQKIEEALRGPYHEMLTEESRGLDLLRYVAAGRLDGCYEQGFSAWDVAAGVLILREAGGEATDYRGGELDFEDRGLVASNGVLHPSLVGVAREAVT